MMAPNASNRVQSSASPRSSDEKMTLSSFQPKTADHPTSINPAGQFTAQTQAIAPSPIAANVSDYPPDSIVDEDALKEFNESLQHCNSKGTHLTTMSDLTSELGCMLNENWPTADPDRKPAAPKTKRDKTDHVATIIELKMDLAQAHAKNDQLLLLLRQCMAEKMELESKMRASLPSSSRQTKREPAHSHHHSFHAPPSHLSSREPAHNHHHSFHAPPRQHIHRMHPTAHVLSTPKPMAWREETLCTNAHHTKNDYVDKLMGRKFRERGVRVVNH